MDLYQPHQLGKWGEQAAWDFFSKKGYQLCGRNIHLNVGELDLVVRKGNTIVFVEVKTRYTHRWGQPYEAIHFGKQRKLVQLALIYLKKNRLMEGYEYRFDVISVVPKEGVAEIEHIESAFDASDFEYMF